MKLTWEQDGEETWSLKLGRLDVGYIARIDINGIYEYWPDTYSGDDINGCCDLPSAQRALEQFVKERIGE